MTDTTLATAKMISKKRPLNRPAHAWPRGNCRIDILHTRDTFLQQIQRLAPQRGRESIGDMSDHLLTHYHGLLADCPIEGNQTVDNLRIRAIELHQRHQVWRIERMCDGDA